MSLPAPQSVARILRRGHLRVALVALLAVGAVLTAVSLLALRHAQERNLALLSRSIAYSVEAAATFRDAAAARELLVAVVDSEQLAQARVVLVNGEELAVYQRQRERMQALASWLFPTQAAAEISDQGRVIGQVQLRGDGSPLLSTLGWSLAGVLASMGLTGMAVWSVSQRLERRLVAPLQALAAHTRAVRDERAFERRAPAADVQEIHALGADFNALLEVVQAHEAELLRRPGH